MGPAGAEERVAPLTLAKDKMGWAPAGGRLRPCLSGVRVIRAAADPGPGSHRSSLAPGSRTRRRPPGGETRGRRADRGCSHGEPGKPAGRRRGGSRGRAVTICVLHSAATRRGKSTGGCAVCVLQEGSSVRALPSSASGGPHDISVSSACFIFIRLLGVCKEGTQARNSGAEDVVCALGSLRWSATDVCTSALGSAAIHQTDCRIAASLL
ncbi:uncharacterized protein [Macaca fascicularis]|uniref:uncharacterized protein n=1 Tax=Macaca fascicularis TaxID=9541 RepID=UPI00075FC8C7|nr:uncharacterized protein LOC107129373 [Macaca fascicularis]